MGNKENAVERLKMRFTVTGTIKAPDRVQGIKKTGPRGAGYVLFCFIAFFFYFPQNVANAAINVI
jgi:hypothetical protein